MKNYDPNIYCGVHKITVTLQEWDYVGHLFLEVAGNCKGRDILDFDFDICEGYEDNDCNLQYHEDEDYFTAELKNPAGDILEIEENATYMNRLIVGIEITDYIEE